MTRIKTRNPSGGEYSFFTREEFARAIEGGGITADWQIYHTASGRWLPVSAHPTFSQVIRQRESVTQKRSRRTSDLILIYPDGGSARPGAPDPERPDAGESASLPASEHVDTVRRIRPTRRIAVETPERRWSAAVSRPSDPGSYPPMKAESFEEPISDGVALKRVLVAAFVLLVIIAIVNVMLGKPQVVPPVTPARATPLPAPPR